MLTIFSKIFILVESRYIWHETKNNFFGKFVGKDSFGNKYYESKKKKMGNLFWGN